MGREGEKRKIPGTLASSQVRLSGIGPKRDRAFLAETIGRRGAPSERNDEQVSSRGKGKEGRGGGGGGEGGNVEGE